MWATGFRFDFSWIEVPEALDAQGYPLQHRGVGHVPGLYYLGLNWLSKRKSGIIFGVAEDARYLGDRIAVRVRTPQALPSELALAHRTDLEPCLRSAGLRRKPPCPRGRGALARLRRLPKSPHPALPGPRPPRRWPRSAGAAR